MTQQIIALLGISGVGKTTFLRLAQRTLPFQHLTAGSLINRAREAATDRDALRLQSVDLNQLLLLEGMALAIDPAFELVVLDGHAVVDGVTGLVSVGFEVFAKLGVCGIAHLEALPGRIKQNRESDGSRQRPLYEASELLRHQEASALEAQRIADHIGVPFVRLDGDIDDFIAFVQSLSEVPTYPS